MIFQITTPSGEEKKANALVERLKQEYDACIKQMEAYSKEDIIENAVWIDALQKKWKISLETCVYARRSKPSIEA